MPADYTLDLERCVVLSVYTGRLTDDDVLQHQRRLSTDPQFHAGFHQIVDGRAITELAVTSAGVREIAQANLFSAQSRRAMVAATAAQFGLARMFQLLRGRAPEQIEVFYDFDAAHAWVAAARDP